MGLHRLLQRAFAQLYGYDVSNSGSRTSKYDSVSGNLGGDDCALAALSAANMIDLHFKLKGARDMF